MEEREDGQYSWYGQDEVRRKIYSQENGLIVFIFFRSLSNKTGSACDDEDKADRVEVEAKTQV